MSHSPDIPQCPGDRGGKSRGPFRRGASSCSGGTMAASSGVAVLVLLLCCWRGVELQPINMTTGTLSGAVVENGGHASPQGASPKSPFIRGRMEQRGTRPMATYTLHITSLSTWTRSWLEAATQEAECQLQHEHMACVLTFPASQMRPRNPVPGSFPESGLLGPATPLYVAGRPTTETMSSKSQEDIPGVFDEILVEDILDPNKSTFLETQRPLVKSTKAATKRKSKYSCAASRSPRGLRSPVRSAPSEAGCLRGRRRWRREGTCPRHCRAPPETGEVKPSRAETTSLYSGWSLVPVHERPRAWGAGGARPLRDHGAHGNRSISYPARRMLTAASPRLQNKSSNFAIFANLIEEDRETLYQIKSLAALEKIIESLRKALGNSLIKRRKYKSVFRGAKHHKGKQSLN
ncbi:uncharacterized protein LOC141579804 [Camelus bactrianus]|uniref:Uncharacterized protein LOC141579804 n=1 Tax=Camelus bactrianus TaxID=9837 RepID=A0AC58RJN2_CAMBA